MKKKTEKISPADIELLKKNGIKPSKDADAPGVPVEAELKIKITLEHWEGFCGSSRMRMKFADNALNITAGKKQIGEVIGCLGGAVEFHLNGLQYAVSGQALWDAFCEAINKPKFKITKSKK